MDKDDLCNKENRVKTMYIHKKVIYYPKSLQDLDNTAKYTMQFLFGILVTTQN